MEKECFKTGFHYSRPRFSNKLWH